jgi:ASCH domain-containing protein
MPLRKNPRDVVRIKALSIGQPWAELILRHRKPFELRTWKTKYRGPLLIHVSQRINTQATEHLGLHRHDLTLGAFVGCARLVDVRPFTRQDARLLKKKRGDYGPWEPDYFAWVLKGVHRVKPIPFKGRLGLFTPPATILRRLRMK